MNIPTNPKSILICAGEASGDLLAAQLVQSIQSQDATINFYGMGGKKMQNTGVKILFNSNKMAVVGILEILKHLKSIFSAFKIITQWLKKNKPHLVILIDYPGFNLRLAKKAKKEGCKVMYYISPQIWAWNHHRIKQIKKYVDHMVVLFQFEETLYKKEKIPVTFVGHPLIDIVKPSLPREIIYQQHQLNPKQPIVALLPGSRHNEITRLLPIMIQTVMFIRHKIPNVQFILPLANSIKHKEIIDHLTPRIKVIEHQNYNLFSITDVAIAASGTVTLELTLQKIPMVILYAASPITAWLAKRFITIKYLGLCNIIANKQVVKELLQENAKPELIAQEVLKLLTNQIYRENMIKELNFVANMLGNGNCSAKAAKVVFELLKTKCL